MDSSKILFRFVDKKKNLKSTKTNTYQTKNPKLYSINNFVFCFDFLKFCQ